MQDQEALITKNKGRFLLFDYINAWLKYAGEILIKASDIIGTVKRSFTDIKPPQKDEFYQ